MSAALAEACLMASLLAAGAVHLIPAMGMRSARHLQALYGLPLHDRGVILLLRHRALLFAMLGAGLIAVTLLLPAWRVGAALVALVSMLGFVVLGGSDPAHDARLRRVARIDLILSAALAGSLALRLVLGGRA